MPTRRRLEPRESCGRQSVIIYVCNIEEEDCWGVTGDEDDVVGEHDRGVGDDQVESPLRSLSYVKRLNVLRNGARRRDHAPNCSRPIA